MKLTSNDASSLVEIWNSLKPYISSKDRTAAAEHFLTAIQDNALVDLEECASDLYGACGTLDKALKAYDVEDDYSDEYEEEEW